MSSGCGIGRSSRVSEAAVLVDRLSSLAAAMRAQGTRVGVGELLAAPRALAAVDPSSRDDARLALRAVMCSERNDLPRFELAFVAVFGREAAVPPGGPLADLGTIEREALPHAAIPGAVAPELVETGDMTAVPAAWSDAELLHEKDFAAYTEAEMALARELIARLARRGPTRLSRRTRPVHRRRGHQPDLRRVLRASLRTAGEAGQPHRGGPPRPAAPGGVGVGGVRGGRSPR